MSKGEVAAPQFGVTNTEDALDGLELLAKSRRADDRRSKKKVRLNTGDAKQMMSKEVLSSDDFKKMRKLQLQKSVETQLGRKRTALEMSDSSESGDDSDSDSSRDDER